MVGSVEDKIELIAAGQAVAIVPLGSGTIGPRPDLAVIPLEDVEPSHVVLATRAGDRSRLVTAFRKHAEALLTGPGAFLTRPGESPAPARTPAPAGTPAPARAPAAGSAARP